MDHTPTITERGQTTDAHVFIKIRCCDDPTSEQSHSFLITPDTDASQLRAWVDAKKAAVAAQHAATQSALQILHELP